MNEIVWDSRWLGLAGLLGVSFFITLGFAWYWSPVRGWRRLVLATLKAAALTLLIACLLNPTRQTFEPKPGENVLLFAVDQSRSLDLRDATTDVERRAAIEDVFADDEAWLNRLEDDFQTQYYGIGERLGLIERPEAHLGREVQSHLLSQTAELIERYDGRPLAGVVVMTDGLTSESIPPSLTSDRVPVFPVLIGDREPPRDLSLEEVVSVPTNFETTPLILTAKFRQVGLAGKTVIVVVLDEDETELTRQSLPLTDRPEAIVNLEVPEFIGPLARYRVIARLSDELSGSDEVVADSTTEEVTLLNNHKRVIVPRQGGPFRILYVAGRPNWEFKFLRRAALVDSEIKLVGLLRLAVKEPRFAFLDRRSGSRNPLFDGFSETGEDEAAEYNEPVLVRLGTLDDEELRDGFPSAAADLFEYDAIVLDDVDAEFFNQDQLDLLKMFVDLRGGGLLMLGGPQAFDQGGFDRSSLADILPVYSETRPNDIETPYRWQLTREGWLEPWVRLRDTQAAESRIRSEMPDFLSVNHVARVKPGARLLGTLDGEQQMLPGLATQNYGRGRTAALMVGDLFRWKLQTPTEKNAGQQGERLESVAQQDDFGQVWRQLLRWMVADIPRRVSAESQLQTQGLPARDVMIDVRNADYRPEDGAKVDLEVTYPDGTTATESAKWTLVQGQYTGQILLGDEGYYEVKVRAVDREGLEIGETVIGWTWEPTGDEYRQLTLPEATWEQVAESTGGRVLSPEELKSVGQWLDMESLPQKQIRQKPLWHQWPILTLALALLAIEWGWRRWLGMA